MVQQPWYGYADVLKRIYIEQVVKYSEMDSGQESPL